METRGIIVKLKGKSCIVLTPCGEYREVPLPKTGSPAVGREIFLVRKKLPSYLRNFMVAASLLVFIMAGQFLLGQTPPAAAYLTIDINPSVELAVASNGRVVSSRGLNSDGDIVLGKVKVDGRDLYEAVELIVAQAVTDQYLGKDDENVILTTLTFEDNVTVAIEMDSVCQAIKNPLNSSGVDAEIIVEPVGPEMRREAKVNGISTGRYLIMQKSEERGEPVSVKSIGSVNLGSLEKEKKVTIIELVDEDDKDKEKDKKTDDDNDKYDYKDIEKDKNGDKDARERGDLKAAGKRGIYIERQKDKNKAGGKTDEGAAANNKQHNTGDGKRPH